MGNSGGGWLLGGGRCPVVQDGQGGDVTAQVNGERLCQPPLPVGAGGAGRVDPGVLAQMEPVGQRNDGHVRHAGQAGTDHRFGQIFGGTAQIPAGVGHILGAGVFPPAFGGHVVVGAGVDDAVPGVGVGQIIARLPAVKRKLHDLHARVAAGCQHRLDFRGQIAQILGDDAAFAQGFVQGVDEGAVGAFDPLAACRRLVGSRDGVVALKAAEMVDANHIVDRGGVLHPAFPPCKALGLMAGPVVERVAPELAIGCKGIRRAAGHLRQVYLAVGLEQFRPGPQVAGIGADVDGDVAHQQDALAVGVVLQRVPLGVEEELDRLEVADRLGQPLLRGRESRRLPGAQIVRPVAETGLMLLGLDCHKEGVIVQPEALRLTERRVLWGGVGQQPVGGLLQEDRTLVVERTILDGADGQSRRHFVLGQQTLLGQNAEIDEIGVARKSGKALVRAVAVTGGADGKDLPVGLSGTGQKIHEAEGFFSECTDPERTGQAEYGHQNAACTHDDGLLTP